MFQKASKPTDTTSSGESNQLSANRCLSIEEQAARMETFNYGDNAPPSYKNCVDSKTTASSKSRSTSSYSDMYRSIETAKEKSKGAYKLLSRVATMLICSVTITVILAILMAIPIIMIIIGTINIHECSMQKMIPIWLIVFGALSIIKNLSTLIQRIKYLRRRGEEKVNSSSTVLNVFDSFMALFLLIWFVCGNIWIYGNNSRFQHLDKSAETTYCNALAFYFSFWIVTSIYILIAVSCFLFCCTVCLTIFIPTKK